MSLSDYEPKCKKTLPIIFDDRMPGSNLTPKLVSRVNDNTEDLKNLYEETETMQGDIESLQEDVDDKLDAPETAGTAGQVLTSDGEGGAVWASVGSGEIVVDPTLTVEGAAADAKKTGDEITHLKQDISESESAILADGDYNILYTSNKPNNLINKYRLIAGEYINANGGVSTATGWNRTDYIDISAYSKICLSGGMGNCGFYNANKEFISTVSGNRTEGYTVPTGAVYIRCSVTDANKNTVMLNGGTSVPAYDEGIVVKDIAAIQSALTASLKYLGNVQASNYSTLLPDCNGASVGYYIVNFSAGATSIPAHLPFASFDGRLDILITYGNPSGYKRQVYINNSSKGLVMYSRGSGGNNWDAWESIGKENAKTVIVDKAGNGDYTSLTEAIRSNLTAKCNIYVRKGEYDLIDEFEDKYGSGYFDSMSSTSYDEGLQISNRTCIYMDADAVVKYEYTGSNEFAIKYFSPFKFSGNGGELHGGQIICSNCRYAIHDDCYTSEYDNRITDGVYIYYRSSRGVAIGGGLGKSSHVELKNCYVDSNLTGAAYGVFYHNNSVSADALNFVSIHDNYFTADIVIEPFGPSEHISKALVSNNKARSVRHYQPSAADNPPDIDNFEMVAWNNTVTQ